MPTKALKGTGKLVGPPLLHPTLPAKPPNFTGSPKKGHKKG